MLVVTRNTHESVVVGEDDGQKHLVKVTVLSVDGSRVKLGIDVQNDASLERLEDWYHLHGDGLTDRHPPLQPFVLAPREEHRRDSIPHPGPNCWPATAVGEFA